MTWSNIENGESASSVQNKINTLGNQVDIVLNSVNSLSGATIKLPVADGEAITAGDVVDILNNQITKKGLSAYLGNPVGVTNSGSGIYNASAVVALSNTQILVVYNSASVGLAAVGTITGTSISFGTLFNFYASATNDVTVTRLSDTKAVIAFCTNDNPRLSKSVVATISGTTISIGAITTPFGATGIQYLSMISISDTQVLITGLYAYTTSYVNAVVGTISGTSITFGSISANPVYTSSNVSISKLSATKAILVSVIGGSCTALVIVVTGTTASFGTSISTTLSDGYSITRVTAISDNQAIIAVTNLTKFQALVATISGTDITVGTLVQLYNYNVPNFALGTISNNRGIITYYHSTTAHRLLIVSVSGNSLILGREVAIGKNSSGLSTCGTYGDRVVVVSRSGSTAYGEAIVGQVNGREAIAIESGTTGQTIKLTFDGVAFLNGVSKGAIMTSTGAKAFAFIDNYIDVTGYWKNYEFK